MYGNFTTPARITIGAEVSIEGLTRDAERAVVRANTILNPAFASKERMGLWTGDTDPTITTWRHTPAGLVVSRGGLAHVVCVCRRYGLAFDVTDRTVCPPLGITLTPTGVLYDFQSRALDDLLRRVCRKQFEVC